MHLLFDGASGMCDAERVIEDWNGVLGIEKI